MALLAFIGAITACSPRIFNVSLEPQALQTGELVYRYSDVAGPLRPDDAETEQKRVAYMNEWVANAGICKNGFEVFKRVSITTNTSIDGKRIFYFLRCK